MTDREQSLHNKNLFLKEQNDLLKDKIQTLEETIEGYKKIAKWCDNCEQIAELEKRLNFARGEFLRECKEVKNLLKENAELKENNLFLNNLVKEKEQRGLEVQEDLLKENAELEKENAELKKEWQEQVQKATDEGYARTLQTIQLTKAKEIIKDLLSLCEGETDSKLVFARAEQFLKDSEVEK